MCNVRAKRLAVQRSCGAVVVIAAVSDIRPVSIRLGGSERVGKMQLEPLGNDITPGAKAVGGRRRVFGPDRKIVVLNGERADIDNSSEEVTAHCKICIPADRQRVCRQRSVKHIQRRRRHRINRDCTAVNVDKSACEIRGGKTSGTLLLPVEQKLTISRRADGNGGKGRCFPVAENDSRCTAGHGDRMVEGNVIRYSIKASPQFRLASGQRRRIGGRFSA